MPRPFATHAMGNWRDIADAADEVRRNTKHGQREVELSKLLPGVDVEMVRRTLRVADFLDELTKKNAKLAQALLRSDQFFHLEILARWFALNQRAAIAAAQEMLKGMSERKGKSTWNTKSTIRGLRKAFDEYRRQLGDTGRIAGLTPTPALLSAIGKLLGGEVTDPETRPSVLGRRRFVDLTLKLDQGGKVAVILVGPFVNPQIYTKRMSSVILNAWAMAWAFDDVVVALPEGAPMAAYRRWLIDAQGDLGLEPTAGPRVHLLTMEAKFYGRHVPVHGEGALTGSGRRSS